MLDQFDILHFDNVLVNCRVFYRIIKLGKYERITITSKVLS